MNEILRNADLDLDAHGRLTVQGKPVVTEAPRDGKYYARRNAAWADIAKLLEGIGGGGASSGDGDGSQGPPGPQGPEGPQGPPGSTGATGPQGPAGADSTVPGPAGPAGATGPAGPKGDTGDTGATGSMGPAGPQGEPGADGSSGAIGEWSFNNTVAEPPGGGQIRLNNANQTLATKMWISDITALSKDVANYLNLFIESDGRIYIQDRDNSARWQMYDITGPMVDKGVYVEVPIAWTSGGTALSSGQRALFSPLVPVDTLNEAPNDGQQYGRQSLGWTLIPDEVTGGHITISSTAPSSPAVGDVWIDNS